MNAHLCIVPLMVEETWFQCYKLIVYQVTHVGGGSCNFGRTGLAGQLLSLAAAFKPVVSSRLHYYKNVSPRDNRKLFNLQKNVVLFQGAMQDVHLITGSYGYLSLCPSVDSTCPTCGQFSLLQSTVQELTKHIKELSERVYGLPCNVIYAFSTLF